MEDIIELNDFGNDMSFKRSSTNFGGGIELLMNDRVKDSSKKSSNIGLDDLTSLENELNELSDLSFKPKSELFNGKISFDDGPYDKYNVQECYAWYGRYFETEPRSYAFIPDCRG